jgi:hypothetical protein
VAWYAAFVASFALLITLQKSLLVTPTTYSNELTVPGMQLILSNLKGYWAVTLWVIPMPSGFLSDIALAAFIAVAMSGAWRVFGSAAAGGSGLPLRARVACVPLPVWYLLAYLSALALASISPARDFCSRFCPSLSCSRQRASGIWQAACRVRGPTRSL